MDYTHSGLLLTLAIGLITISNGQEFLSEAQGLAVMQGTNVTLFCSVENLGALNVIWSHNGAVLSMNHMVIGGDTKRLAINGKYNLRMTNVTLADEGEYLCQVTSLPPIYQRSFINVTVQSTVELLNKTADIETTLHENITLQCAATGKPQPNITWSREDNSLPDGKKKRMGDTLTLTTLEYNHGGLYRCTAYNGVGEPDTDSVRVDVFYKPMIHTKSKTVHTGPGIRTKIPCIVSGQPHPAVEWRHNGTVLNLRNLPQHKELLVVEKGFKIDYSLVIRGLQDDDLGSYSCKVSNTKGSESVKLMVTALPSKVKITSSKVGNFSSVYDVMWTVTSAVLPQSYNIRLREVNGTAESDWNTYDVKATAKEGATEHAQTYSFSELSPDTEYEIKIRAYNRYGWGEPNSKFTFMTNEPGFTPPPTTEPSPIGSRKNEDMFYDPGNVGTQLSPLPWATMLLLTALLVK